MSNSMQCLRQTIARDERRQFDHGPGWGTGSSGAARARWASALVACAVGVACAEPVELDASEVAGVPAPSAEFDPAERIIPLPNALLLDTETGRVSVPPSCGEEPGSAAEGLRNTLGQLDGFGTSQLNLTATFSVGVDPASLTGRVALVRLAQRGVPIPSPEAPVPIDVFTARTPRVAPDCETTELVPTVVIRPRATLEPASTYAVVIARGVATEEGVEFEPSVTWALVRQEQAPVRFAQDAEPAAPPVFNATPFDPAEPEELASLRGLDLLWRAHAPLLTVVDSLGPVVLPDRIGSREDILLAWAFDTQTISDALDPSVEGSPAQYVAESAAALVVGTPAAGEGAPATVEQALAAALPGVSCEALGCAAIGTLYAAGPASSAPTFTSSSYLLGDDCSEVAAPALAFDDPIAPTHVCDRQLPVLAVVPLAAPPASGYPTVIFAHGIGRSKEDLLSIAGTLAGAGIASVAVDALDHGVRAVQVSSDAAAGCDAAGPGRPCAEAFGPTCAPQCFAPLLSPNLAVTRDHLRQTVLDHLALARALAACAAPGACGDLQVDPARIGYVGHSLGSLIGGVSVAVSSDISAAVLNVGGADWLSVLSETETLSIRCPLVDALIASGVIEGVVWNLGANPDATCVGDSWKTDPGFVEFTSAARWILDPVDPVNFVRFYSGPGAPSVLVSEVVEDPVVPNVATATFASALGLTPAAGELATGPTPAPTPAVVEPGSAWIRYQNADADPATMFPGNGFGHGSLLQPAEPSAAMVAPSGELGTIRMRVDAVAFLMSHWGGNP